MGVTVIILFLFLEVGVHAEKTGAGMNRAVCRTQQALYCGESTSERRFLKML